MTIEMTVEQFRQARGEPIKQGNAPPHKPTTRKPSDLEQRFIDNSGRLPPFEREYRFHPTRAWRFDFAWPALKLAVEVQGGNFKNGGHNRGASQSNDFEKLNAAQLAGWRVLQFGTKQMDNIAEVMDVVLIAIASSTPIAPGVLAGAKVLSAPTAGPNLTSLQGARIYQAGEQLR